MRYFQAFRIAGVENSIEYDGGLKSSEAEPKRLIAVHVEVEKYAATDDNEVQGYHERAKVFDIPEKMFADELNDATSMSAAGTKRTSVPVDLDIPAGESFKVAMKCAATAVDIRGMYEYEII
ncbi:unnamed protein product [marine sediment metagenome]|uniref:Uncharacterized protein n=1 Tax=marine sediment metagenome TaxID=412755 RepID=X1GFE9_9ZZZZ